ncbi:MAG: DNA double-strand break repair nuclease NurA [Chloroflexota bacterium]|nr:DNA double-strand break repair nuclease NurA [Chloroflexota bacterium]
MSLDLGATINQLELVSRSLGQDHGARQRRLAELREAAAGVPAREARQRTQEPGLPFLAAQVVDVLLDNIAPPAAPSDWTALSVDGSHIDVDRHLPVPCYLINLGGCAITYGSGAGASFFSRPRLASRPEELYLRHPEEPNAEEAVTGNLLGMYRTVRELWELLEETRRCPPDQPILALVDGTLVMWGLAGRAYPEFVRRHIIEDGLLQALRGFQELARERKVALAAYVSLPRTTEVVNAIRRCLCSHSLESCQKSCSNRRADLEPCSRANDFLDRDVFGEELLPYHRSPLYRTLSSVPRDFYGPDQQVYFYYLHTGEEIARIEVPQWVAMDETLLAQSHSLIVEQCRRGQGYPVVITESHEQAVITGRDRQLFREMVAATLERQGLPNYTSQKERSKQRPWV